MTLPAGVRLEEEYFALARALRSAIAARIGDNARPVIGIAGESGSGKSVTAICLARELSDNGTRAEVLHQDDYFLRPPRANHDHRVADLAHVGPHEVDLDLIAAHILAFRNSATSVVIPRVDYPTDRFLSRVADFSAIDALVVEGTYVLTLDDLDVRVFLEATHRDTRDRRRARARDVDAPIIDEILEIEHRLIAPQSRRADIVIGRDFSIGRS